VRRGVAMGAIHGWGKHDHPHDPEGVELILTKSFIQIPVIFIYFHLPNIESHF
jgi:hypothetical protein